MLKHVSERLSISDVPTTGNLIAWLTGLMTALKTMLSQVGYAVNRLIERWAPSSPAQITADQNNYDIGDAPVLRLSTDASRTITGFKRGERGRTLLILNVGAQNIVLANQSASSDAANRIITGTGANYTIAADTSAYLFYDDTTLRWRKIA